MMPSWKTIAASLALSAFAGILGSACTGEMEKTATTPEADSATVVTPGSTIPVRLIRRGMSPERRRCLDDCLRRFNRCSIWNSRACRRDRDRCTSRCWQF